MKRLFTLVALMACFLGAKAAWSEKPIYTIDYSTKTGFPFYVMGYVPEFDNGYMTDFGANYKYAEKKDDAEETSDVIVKTQAGVEYYRWTEGGGWHQYFIADGIPTKIDGKYKVIAKVKASATVSINVNMGWSWEETAASATVVIPEGSDFQEVEWEYTGINGSSCNLVAQPGNVTEIIEWLSLEVYEWEKEGQRPKEWLQDIENGDAEKSWAELGLADVKFDDTDNNFKVCAWGKERGEHLNDDGGWDPFPATIEEEDGNHYFVVHGKAATTEGDAAAWDNQFWIQSKHAWPAGTSIKLKFRYKASKNVTVPTQTHAQNPSNYIIWHGAGDVSFTTEWQNYEKDVTFADDMAGGWSFAFQLNQNDKEAIDFYFDDLSWEYLKLDDGYFLSGINTNTTDSYDDLDNAVQFEDDGEYLVATFGTKGDANTYVDQIMISTKRGDDQAFKGSALRPEHKVADDLDDWQTYTTSSNYKIDLPGLGVWKVYIDLAYEAMAFEMLEGTPYEEPDPIDIVTNAKEVTVNGLERDWLTAGSDGNPREAEVGTGETWDNQFFLVANRTLKPGEVTVIKFSYKANKEAKTTTQLHAAPGAYIHHAAIGDVTFTEDWQDIEIEYTIPKEADGKDAQSIAFNMAEIKEACDYELKDFQWYIKYDDDATKTTENLINAEGTKNFYVKEGAGTNPYEFGTDPSGISTVKANAATNAIYNIAGQRVNKAFKGIVVKNGTKYVVK